MSLALLLVLLALSTATGFAQWLWQQYMPAGWWNSTVSSLPPEHPAAVALLDVRRRQRDGDWP